MNPQNQTPRKPTIILKFKNPTMPMDQTESDYSDDDQPGQEYLHFGPQTINNHNTTPRNKKIVTTSTSNEDQPMFCCQVDGCSVDLTAAKPYHRRHKVCEVHAKSPAAVVSGLRQRFCQQCSRFHDVSEFDDARRSCRNRLARRSCRNRLGDPNQRRRKSSFEASDQDVIEGEGGSRQESLSHVGERSSSRRSSA